MQLGNLIGARNKLTILENDHKRNQIDVYSNEEYIFLWKITLDDCKTAIILTWLKIMRFFFYTNSMRAE